MEGLEFEGTPHRGIDDAINIANIFRKYIDRF
jgi:inhibitor of KinA sporulation pathway (predicted exonuclease)